MVILVLMIAITTISIPVVWVRKLIKTDYLPASFTI